MKYRPFGKLGWEVSVLGFGAMRLPILDRDSSKINEPEATRMLYYAIEQGINYIDTAYIYHGGHSEKFLGKALKNGYREKVKIATKLPSWIVNKKDDFDLLLDEQLKRLQTDYIDVYLLHGLNQTQWPKLRDLGVLELAEKAKQDGRIKHLGFSFHDSAEVFKEIVDAYDHWEVCQIQYNYMDIEFQAGLQGLQYATERGLAVVIMEPLRGGQLTRKPSQKIAVMMENAPLKLSQADLALQWIWNHPEVSVILSGMSEMEHVEENIKSAEKATVAEMTAEELQLVDDIRAEYLKTTPIPCTSCQYCMPCPEGVHIFQIFELYNDGQRYQDHVRPRMVYKNFLGGLQADACVECHECEEACPQEIPIIEWLKTSHGWMMAEP